MQAETSKAWQGPKNIFMHATKMSSLADMLFDAEEGKLDEADMVLDFAEGSNPSPQSCMRVLGPTLGHARGSA